MRHVQNWPAIENPHFWSYPHETLWKWLSHEVMIFTMFHKDVTKNLDFSLLTNFWECLFFISSDFSQFYSPSWVIFSLVSLDLSFRNRSLQIALSYVWENSKKVRLLLRLKAKFCESIMVTYDVINCTKSSILPSENECAL